MKPFRSPASAPNIAGCLGSKNKGDLEKLLWLSVAGIFGVNSTESEGEQTGIIREQIQAG